MVPALRTRRHDHLPLSAASVIGCAPKIYNVNMRYQPTKVIPPAVTDGRKYSLTVAAFIDRRKMDDTLLIGRVIHSDGSSIPILPRYVKADGRRGRGPPRTSDPVGIRRLSGESGLGSSGKHDPAGLGKDPRRRRHRGARRDLPRYDPEKALQRQGEGDAGLRRRPEEEDLLPVTSESSSTLDHIVFSEEKLESQINGVLSEAMEKAIEGPETATDPGGAKQ